MSSYPYIVAALYKFVEVSEPHHLREDLLALCKQHDIQGTLLLAKEGINGTVAGSRTAIDHLKAFLDADERFHDLEYKESFSIEPPFLRVNVMVKNEIVTMRHPDVNPGQLTGTYVDAEDWNALISDPETIVIDTRNDYEVRIGTFKGAVNPQTENFSEFPSWIERTLGDPKYKKKKIAMFCTGAIRCTKASSYMLAQGYENVFQLKGGILKYLEIVPEEQSLWQGECFVFDNRVAVKHALQLGEHDQCYGCRAPLSPENKLSPHYQPGISCEYCINVKTGADRRRFAERHKQVQYAKQTNRKHLGR